MFMVQFGYIYDKYLIVVYIPCAICNKNVNFDMYDIVAKGIIVVFIKAVLFIHVGLSWLIQAKKKIELYIDETCTH